MSRSTAQHRGETLGSETSLKVTHIRVEDVTDDTQLIELSREICFNQYMQIYGAGHAETDSPQQLWEDSDLSGKVEWLKTLMAFDVSTNPATPLATCNFKIGSLCKRVNVRLDFQRYLKTKNGVELKSLGVLPERTLEVSMFAFAPALSTSKDLETKVNVFRQIHSHGILLGQQHGCDQYWSVLARPFARFVKIHCKLPCERLDEFVLNTEESSDLFARFPRYWQQGRPGLYQTGSMIINTSEAKQTENSGGIASDSE